MPVMSKSLVVIALQFFGNKIVFNFLILFDGKIGSWVRGTMPYFVAWAFLFHSSSTTGPRSLNSCNTSQVDCSPLAVVRLGYKTEATPSF